VRCFTDKARATSTPAAQWRHIRLSPGFIDEDQPGRINPSLILLPLYSTPGHVRPVLPRERLS
jgi:hypothetical protein